MIKTGNGLAQTELVATMKDGEILHKKESTRGDKKRTGKRRQVEIASVLFDKQ